MTYDGKLTNNGRLNQLVKMVFVLTAVGFLASCDKKNTEADGEAKIGQSIVRVNGDEITIHQLNIEMQRANVRPEQQDIAGKQITKSLVDRQILVQEAVKSKLDRNPNVMQAIESAKAQVLAQAYLESKVPAVAPTEAEVTSYRIAHPEIFANRKVYVMDEAAFVVDPANAQDVQLLSQTAKTVEDVTAWLDAHQIKYTRSSATHAAETVPAELLAKLSKMVAGDLIFVNGNGRTMVGRVVDVKNVPISDADAKPIIERILAGEGRKKAAEAELARLRGLAKIEYINKKFEPSAAAANPAEVASDTNKTLEPQAQPDASAANIPQDKSLEKGLSGL
jgi:EpsD family peptidyl-prolyl cis-trans isomerase